MGVLTFSLKQIFDFITDLNIEKGHEQDHLEDMINNLQADNEEDEQIFAGVHIPRTLEDVT